MTDDRLVLEQQIHGLLCGELSPGERQTVLARLAREEAARKKLEEMLAFQEQCRASLGYDRADEAMEAPMARLRASVRAERTRRAGPGEEVRRRGRRPWPVWLVRAAAAIVIAASVFVAGLSYRNSRVIQERLAALHAPLTVTPVTSTERDVYRHIWEEVAAGGPEGRPWVLLSDGTGEFGYLPPADAEVDGPALILVRCLLASLDGQEIETVNLLLPRRRIEGLSLPGIGRVAGEPISCDLTAARGRAAIGLTVGEVSAGSSGIRGTASIDGPPVEIGQFSLDGRRVRVVVHVTSLEKAVG